MKTCILTLIITIMLFIIFALLQCQLNPILWVSVSKYAYFTLVVILSFMEEVINASVKAS